jgi:hypothetical protein
MTKTRKYILVGFTAALLSAPPAALHAAEPADPLQSYLDDKAPELLREVEATNAPPEGTTVRRVVFRSRDDSEVFAVIAAPKSRGKQIVVRG